MSRYFPADLAKDDVRSVLKALIKEGRLPVEEARRVARAMAFPLGVLKPGNTGYTANAVFFDGTNDYMTRGADLTGTADSTKITASVWVRTNIDDQSLVIWCGATAAGGSSFRNLIRTNGAGDELTCFLHNSAGTGIVDLRTTGAVFQVSSGWVHWVFSCDLTSTSLRHSYVNDASNGSWNVYTNSSIDFTIGDFSVGARPNGANKWNGDIADLLVWQGV